MNNELLAIAAIILIVLISSVMATRFYVAKRNRKLLAERIESFVPVVTAQSFLKPSESRLSSLDEIAWFSALLQPLKQLLFSSGLKITLTTFLLLSVAIAAVVYAITSMFNLHTPVCIGLALIAVTFPTCFAAFQAHKRRKQFIEQLPNAIDLMISVLKSGHSIPQSIKTVSQEVPAPCGTEFAEILQRMNLGQSLHEAMIYSIQRYSSFELDLIRRATQIQVEVGGSLAELLDKTNQTLRQRLKLQRHISVITGPSKLSAVIVGLMPFVISFFFLVINPEYMNLLFETNIGRGLVLLALGLQIMGVYIMNRMVSFKV